MIEFNGGTDAERAIEGVIPVSVFESYFECGPGISWYFYIFLMRLKYLSTKEET
jgi:hypothetical protein